MDTGAWQTTVHGVAKVRLDLATKPPPTYNPWPALYPFFIKYLTFSQENLCLYSQLRPKLTIHVSLLSSL